MHIWSGFPFVRYSLFLATGIILGDWFPLSDLSLVCSALLILSALYVITRVIAPKSFQWSGYMGLPFISLAGYVLILFSSGKWQESHLIHSRGIAYYQAVVVSDPVQGRRTWRWVVELEAASDSTDWRRAGGRVQVTILSEHSAAPVRYGDVLLIKGNPRLLQHNSNPHAFDYARYLEREKIFHQHFIDSASFLIIDNRPTNALKSLALRIRHWSQQRFKDFLNNKDSYAFASALVLGAKEDLDDDVVTDYATTGGLHVLAVSGLHVGILYGLIALLFRPFTGARVKKWMVPFISIILLWLYAAVTGFSPSVLRAVTMLTCLLLATPLTRKTNIYNSLGFAAFVLMALDPFILFKVGFQLSFVAVLSIVYFYPRLNPLWTPRTRIGLYLWQLACVSVAAQAGTCVLGMFYFHQFPIYFLLTNVLVIPGAFLVLVLGLGILLFGVVEPVGRALGFLLDWIITGMNAAVKYISSLPASTIHAIHITPLQCVLLMVLVILLSAFVERKRMSLLYTGFVVGVFFGAMRWTDYHASRAKSTMALYAVPGHSVIEFTAGQVTCLLADSAFTNQPDQVDFHISGNRRAHYVKESLISTTPQFVRNLKGCRLILWQNRLVIQILDKNYELHGLLKVDHIIISNNSINRLEDLASHLSCRSLILDSSNSRATSALAEAARRAGWFVHVVREDGYFELAEKHL